MIDNWPFQWKMNFNPDPIKRAQELILGCKTEKLPHLPLQFNNVNINQYTKRLKHHIRLYVNI